MHETDLSRSALITLGDGTPLAARPGRHMFIILDGAIRFDFLDQQEVASIGAYADIPAGVAFQMVPIGVSPPDLVSFEVPKIAFDNLSTGPFGPESASASAVVRNRDALISTTPTWDDPSDRGWTLAKSDQLRVNLVEMFTELKNHAHPDADHSLILLSGAARVVTPTEERRLDVGTFVSIPAGVPHKYYIDGHQPALFVSFDAPAYDPAQTRYLE